MAVLKITSPARSPIAPSAVPGQVVPSSSASSAGVRGAIAFISDWLFHVLVIVQGTRHCFAAYEPRILAFGRAVLISFVFGFPRFARKTEHICIEKYLAAVG